MTEPSLAPAPPRVIEASTRSTTRASSERDRRDGVARLLLGPVRRRADAVRARPVHDDRGHGRRQDRPAAVLGRVAAGRGRHSGYEFYVRLVQGGTFTTLLWEMPVGQKMRMIGPKGKFMLTPGDERTHIFISSGTGNAPFVSMMKQALADGTPRRAVFLNGVSYAHEIGYRGLLEGWERSGGYPVTYIPTVSRASDPSNASWTGRTGRVETILEPVLDELGLSAANSVAYICGNPDMITPPKRRCSAATTRRSRSTRSCTGRRARSPAASPRATSPPRSTPPRRTRTSRPGQARRERWRQAAPTLGSRLRSGRARRPGRLHRVAWSSGRPGRSVSSAVANGVALSDGAGDGVGAAAYVDR